MLYCMMRAIIQDLRTTAFTTPKNLMELYDIAMAQPSNKSLSHCRFDLICYDCILNILQFIIFSND